MNAMNDDDLIARRAARFGELLAQADAPARPVAYPQARVARAMRIAVWRWRATAAMVLLAAGAALAPPVRAWIVGAGRALFTRHGPANPSAGTALPSATPAGAVTAAVGDAFTLSFASAQAAGAATFEAEDRQTVLAQVLTPPASGSGAEITVLETGMRVANDAGSRASYLVRVPARLARVVVEITGEPPRTWRPSAAGARWQVDLVRNGRSRTF